MNHDLWMASGFGLLAMLSLLGIVWIGHIATRNHWASLSPDEQQQQLDEQNKRLELAQKRAAQKMWFL